MLSYLIYSVLKDGEGSIPKGKSSAHQATFDSLNADLQRQNILPMLGSAFILITFISGMGTVFSGIPVARLPFTASRFVTSITHKGLEGKDYTQCSYMFLYLLTSMVVRPILAFISGLSLLLTQAAPRSLLWASPSETP